MGRRGYALGAGVWNAAEPLCRDPDADGGDGVIRSVQTTASIAVQSEIVQENDEVINIDHPVIIGHIQR